MNRLVLPWMIFFFLPSFVCTAEMTAPNGTPDSFARPDLLYKQNPENTPHPASTEIPYLFSKLTISDGPVKEVKIDHPKKSAENPLSFVGTAEAAIEPLTLEHFEKVCNGINRASKINDLKSFLSENNLQLLKSEAQAGASEYIVVAMIQAMRPQNIHILDSQVDENHAILAVIGQSYFGPLQGLIHLVKSDGEWKIDKEEWYAGDTKHMVTIFDPASMINNETRDSKDLLTEISPDYKMKSNHLSLTKANYTKEKKAFTFVFFMNKGKGGPRESALTLSGEASASKSNPRPHMHIMWTGSKKLITKQILIEDQYPMDVSVANYEDGFASGEWNLILPRKKPREIIFSLLWSF